jgi:WD40 repeat protein
MRVLQAGSGEVLALAFGPDGRSLAAAVDGQGVFVWDLAHAGYPLRLDRHATKKTRCLFFAPDGRSVHWLGWGGRRGNDRDSGWRVYDRDTGKTAQPRLPAAGTLMWLVPAADGRRVFSQHNFPEPALVGWDRDGDRWAEGWAVSTEHLAAEQLVADPAGRRLALLTRKTNGPRWWGQPFRLELRSAGSGAVEAVGTYPYSYSCPLAFAPDGSALVGAHEMTLLVWPVPDLGAGPLVVRNDSRKHFTAAAYHPAGGHLLVASNDATVHVFDTAGWGRATRYAWQLGRLRSVAVSPDGALAAAGGDRGEVVVWDLDL